MYLKLLLRAVALLLLSLFTVSGAMADAPESTTDTDSSSAQVSLSGRPYGATPEEAFLKFREKQITLLKEVADCKGTSVGARALRAALTPIYTFTATPIKLKDQKVEGDSATLTYVAVDPAVDLTETVRVQHDEKGWRSFDAMLRGKASADAAQQTSDNIRKELPTEIGVCTVSFILIVLSGLVGFVASIWLIINAFRKNILWGLGAFFFPLVQLVFVCLNWSLARKPFFVWLASVGLFIAGAVMPFYYVSSSGDVMDLAAKLSELKQPSNSQ